MNSLASCCALSKYLPSKSTLIASRSEVKVNTLLLHLSLFMVNKKLHVELSK